MRYAHTNIIAKDWRALEVYSYAKTVPHAPGPPNRYGLGHLAFEVDDVEAALAKLLGSGGALHGKVTSKAVEGIGTIAFAYARDPEGDLVEVQSWKRGV